MIDDVPEARRSWGERVFLFACEHRLDPPHRCPTCGDALSWGLRELQALVEGRGPACGRCGLDFTADRRRRPLRYAMG